MQIKRARTGDYSVICRVEVPRWKVKPESMEARAESVKDQIRRHVDDFDSCEVEPDVVYEDPTNRNHETLYDALEAICNFGYTAPSYPWQAVCASTGQGQRGVAFSFESLIVAAYEHPHKFECLKELTEEQQVFVKNVCIFSLSKTWKDAQDQFVSDLAAI